jgi:hypothetical protein
MSFFIKKEAKVWHVTETWLWNSPVTLAFLLCVPEQHFVRLIIGSNTKVKQNNMSKWSDSSISKLLYHYDFVNDVYTGLSMMYIQAC